ncbi:MAG: ligand-binding sensor domain-containing protein [Saprospiraceae bacterium]
MSIKQYTLLVIATLITSVGFGQVIDLNIEQHKSINATPVNTIIVDFGNNKWIGTENGLMKINSSESKTTEVKSNSVVTATMGENERGWMCTYDNKIAMFDREVSYSTNVPSNEIITCMDADRNFIWLGTTNGLYKISLKSKKENESFFEGNSKLPSNRINDILVDQKGTKWVATENGVVEFNGKSWKTHLKKSDISCLIKYKGAILATGNGQMWKFKNKEWSELILPEELSNGPIEDMVVDANNNIWLAGHFLARLDNNWMAYVYDEQDGFTSQHSTTLAVDHRNNIWVGTAGNGLFKINTETVNDAPMAFAGQADIQEVPRPKPTSILLNGENTARGEKEEVLEVTSSLVNPSKKITPEAQPTTPTVSMEAPQYFKQRIVKLGKKVTVNDKRIKIAIWNENANPNDVISVFFNGEEVLGYHQLTNRRRVLSLKIKRGKENQLVVYAHTKSEEDVKKLKIALLHKDTPMDWITLEADNEYCDSLKFDYLRK